jgi:NitT/TauT family transport system substrate-binding protein
LEVKTNLHPYGKPALQDVLEGRADFATCAETPVVFAVMKGERVSIIATIQTTNQENAIIARRDRGIGAIGDLKGRKIATTLGTHGLFPGRHIEAWHRRSGHPYRPAAEEMPDALARGDVDAISAFHLYHSGAEETG